MPASQISLVEVNDSASVGVGQVRNGLFGSSDKSLCISVAAATLNSPRIFWGNESAVPPLLSTCWKGTSFETFVDTEEKFGNAVEVADGEMRFESKKETVSLVKFAAAKWPEEAGKLSSKSG
jgi:hypothetical protein